MKKIVKSEYIYKRLESDYRLQNNGRGFNTMDQAGFATSILALFTRRRRRRTVRLLGASESGLSVYDPEFPVIKFSWYVLWHLSLLERIFQ